NQGGQQHRDVRQRLIHAGLREFEKKGYEGTSVSEIVSAAGVTKGSFYYYFEAKEDLLILIHDEFMDYEHAILDEVEGLELDPSRALARVIEGVCRSVEYFKPHITVFFEQRRYLSGRRFERVRERRRS